MYKDLAKYWMGFVPVTTLLGLGVVLGPTAEQLGQVGPMTWLCVRWPVLVALLFALIALVVMTRSCAKVLAAEPTEFNTLLDQEDWLSDAFSKHAVGRPYFLDSTKFVDAELVCRIPDDEGNFDPRAAAVNDVTARISALSADVNAKAKFQTFIRSFGIGVAVVIGAALFILGSSSGDLQVISDPTPVTVYIPTKELATVTADTGCQKPTDATAVAVGGTWTKPNLRLFGPGCTDVEWAPASSHILITKG